MKCDLRIYDDNVRICVLTQNHISCTFTHNNELMYLIINFHYRYSVLRLQFATETLLSRYGPEVINKHIDLARLAECVIDIYAMTAILGKFLLNY